MKTSNTPQENTEEQLDQNSLAMSRDLNSHSTFRQNARNISLIIKREYSTRVWQRSFIITTIIIMVLLTIGACLPTLWTLLNNKTQSKIAIVNTAAKIAGLNEQELLKYFATNLNANTSSTAGSTNNPHFLITAGTPTQIDTLHQQVSHNTLDILLIVRRTTNQNLDFTCYTNTTDLQSADLLQVQTVTTQISQLDRLASIGLTDSQEKAVFAPSQFNAISTVQENSGRTPAESIASGIASTIAILLIFLAVQQYSMGVALGVTEEKSSRVMEILINAATPFQLLLGKIVGIGLVGLTQMVGVGSVGAIAFLAQIPIKAVLLGTSSSSSSTNSIDITGVSLNLLALMIVYFMLGFLLYATFYAAVGVLVKRQEEVSGAITPILSIFMAAYFASFYAVSTPDAIWVAPLSYVPFFTPMLMLARVGAGTVASWEIILSILTTTAFILICIWGTARIYRHGVLMYGQKPGIGQIITLLRKNSDALQRTI